MMWWWLLLLLMMRRNPHRSRSLHYRMWRWSKYILVWQLLLLLFVVGIHHLGRSTHAQHNLNAFFRGIMAETTRIGTDDGTVCIIHSGTGNHRHGVGWCWSSSVHHRCVHIHSGRHFGSRLPICLRSMPLLSLSCTEIRLSLRRTVNSNTIDRNNNVMDGFSGQISRLSCTGPNATHTSVGLAHLLLYAATIQPSYGAPLPSTTEPGAMRWERYFGFKFSNNCPVVERRAGTTRQP